MLGGKGGEVSLKNAATRECRLRRFLILRVRCAAHNPSPTLFSGPGPSPDDSVERRSQGDNMAHIDWTSVETLLVYEATGSNSRVDRFAAVP